MPDLADPDDFGDVLSLSDTAKLLGVGMATVERYAREGLIPAHRIPTSRRYYVFKDELLEFLRSQPAHPDSVEESSRNAGD